METTMNDIAQLISSVGFPIAASCAMFYLYNKTVQEITKSLTIMNETLNHIMAHIEKEEQKDES